VSADETFGIKPTIKQKLAAVRIFYDSVVRQIHRIQHIPFAVKVCGQRQTPVWTLKTPKRCWIQFP
jgi:hypothetical protein